MLAASLTKLLGTVLLCIPGKYGDEDLCGGRIETACVRAQNGVETITIAGGRGVDGLVVQ